MEQSKINRSMGELFGDLSRDATKLVKHEFEYARAELTQKITGTLRDATLTVIGGAIVYAGLLCLLAAAVCALALAVPWWLAALIVAAATLFPGSVILMVGIYRLRKRNLAPKRTLQHLQEDTEWLRKQIT